MGAGRRRGGNNTHQRAHACDASGPFETRSVALLSLSLPRTFSSSSPSIFLHSEISSSVWSKNTTTAWVTHHIPFFLFTPPPRIPHLARTAAPVESSNTALESNVGDVASESCLAPLQHQVRAQSLPRLRNFIFFFPFAWRIL